MCPYYPAKEFKCWQKQRWQSESCVWRVMGKRAVCGGRRRQVAPQQRRVAKRQLIIPKIECNRNAHKRLHEVCAPTSSHILYTTFVCVLRLCLSALLIYGTLQVPWLRYRALQFMSNLVNILSPVRPVSHCFPLLSVPPTHHLVPPIYPHLKALWWQTESMFCF